MERLDKINLLKEYDGEVKTTKFLKELGLTQHNITQYLNEGYLERIKRGEYRIQINKNKERKNDEYILLLIKELYENVRLGNYEQVYTIAVHICEDKIDNKFDRVLSLVFNLLSCILGKNYDYSYATKLEVNKEEFTEYERLIYGNEYIGASTCINDLVDMLTRNKIIIKEDILMFQRLLNVALEKIKNNENDELRNRLIGRHYWYFIKYLRERNHTASLDNLNKLIEYTTDQDKIKLYNLMRDINLTILDYVKNRKVVINTTGNYKTVTNLEETLSKAIYNHDYFYALYLLETNDYSDNLHKVIGHMVKVYLRLTNTFVQYNAFRRSVGTVIASEKEEETKEVLSVQPEKVEELNDTIISSEKVDSDEVLESSNDETVLTPTQNDIVVSDTDSYKNNCYEDRYARTRKYNVFLSFFNDKEYDFALDCLEELIGDDKESNEYKLYELLSAFIEMRDKKCGFAVCDYSYEGMSTLDLFNKAIQQHDYKTALRNIGKLTYQNDDEFLNMAKVILHNMLDLDKKYGVKEEKLEAEKAVEVPVTQVSESKEYIKYSYDELLDRIQNDRFEEVFENLKKGFIKRKLDRLELNAFRLLEILMAVRDGSLSEDYGNPIYFDGNYFRCFYDAIRYRQIDEIVRYYDMAYERAREKSELNVFAYIIDSIKEEYNSLEDKRIIEEKQKMEIARNAELVSEVNDEIKQILNNKTSLDEDELNQLFDLLEKKHPHDEAATDLELCLLTIIEELLYNPLIDASYFEDLSGKKQNGSEWDYEEINLDGLSIDEKIDKLLFAGDYIRAYSLVYETSFYKCLLKYNNDNRMIIRTLLGLFNTLLNRPLEYERPVDYRSVELKAIQSRIKKNDFLGAFENVLAATHIETELLVEIASWVLVSYLGNSTMEKATAEEFVDALSKNDLNQARIALINYKEVLDRSSYSKVEAYQDKYKSMSRTYEEEKKKVNK